MPSHSAAVPSRLSSEWRALISGLVRRSPRGNAAIIVCSTLILSSVVAGLLVVPGKTFITIFPDDILQFIEVAYRLAQGQRQHVDFHTPLGPIVSVLPFLGLWIADDFGAVMPTALSLSLLLFTPILLYLLVSRFHWLVGVPLAVFIVLLVTAPLVTGEIPSRITTAMWYNRMCWAALALLFLVYLNPRDERPSTQWCDCVTSALLFLFMFYTKVTYAIFALVFLGLWSVLDRRARPPTAFVLFFSVAVGLLIETVWRLHAPYFADIVFAANAGPSLRGGLLVPARELLKNLDQVALLTVVFGFAFRLRAVGTKDLVVALFCVAASILISNQNSGDKALPLLIAPLAVSAERLCRSRGGTRQDLDRTAFFAISLLVAFAAQPVTNCTIALVRHFVFASSASVAPGQPASLDGLRVMEPHVWAEWKLGQGSIRELQGLVEEGVSAQQAYILLRERRHHGTPNLLSNTEYFFLIGKGMEALGQIDHQGRAVFVFDMTNPFPFAMRLPAPRNVLLAYHFGRMFSRETYIAPEKTFESVGIVMVPRFPMAAVERDILLELYGDYVNARFSTVLETPYWTVLARTDCGLNERKAVEGLRLCTSSRDIDPF